jgi:hypothetical protein
LSLAQNACRVWILKQTSYSACSEGTSLPWNIGPELAGPALSTATMQGGETNRRPERA